MTLLKQVVIQGNEESGSYPDPSSVATANDANANIDIFGNLRTRGEVLTDELSTRDDFSGVALGADWTDTLVNGTVTVASSIMELTSSTATEENRITQDIDYCPVTLRGRLKLAGRYANQVFRVGFIHREAGVITSGAYLEFSGTDNTSVDSVTCSSAAASDFETKTNLIPEGVTSGDYAYWKIDVSNNIVTFSVASDGANYDLISQHTLHLPDPYQAMALEIGFENTATATNNTAFVDMIFINNMNRVQIDQDFSFEPLPTQILGKTDSGQVLPIPITTEGFLEIAIKDPVSAFGELITVEPQPVAQIDFVYGVNTLTTDTLLTGSGTVTGSGGLLLCSTTAATTSSAQLTSKRYLKYRPGQGAKGMFTALFTTGVANSKQYAGIFTSTLNNGFGFGYDGVTFGIWYDKGGVPTHIPQTAWNEDLMNGQGGVSNKSGLNLIPTNGNVFRIIFQYLGFGAVKFFIENQFTGHFELVHTIKYANAQTTPSLANPSLNLLWRAENTTNNTNIVVKGASGALFLQGMRKYLGATFGFDNNKSSVTTITNIFTIRNATTYNGVNNRAQIRLRTISFASNTGGAGSGITTCKIIKGATLGGSPSYTTTNGTSANQGVTITSGNSVSSVDTAGTTVTGGTVIFNSIIGVGNNAYNDLTELDLFSNPTETLTFSITSTQSVTTGIAVTWSEDI